MGSRANQPRQRPGRRPPGRLCSSDHRRWDQLAGRRDAGGCVH